MNMRIKNIIKMLVFVLLAVTVFSSSSSAALLETKLIASDGKMGDFLGRSVSISGDNIVVGAYSMDGTKSSAYVFVRSGSTWVEQQKIIARDGATMDSFGYSVSMSGDTIVIGDSYKGLAYVFVRSGSTWVDQQKLTASDGGYYFGQSVSISGDTIVVGNSYKGSAYVFVRSGSVWVEQQKLMASDGAAGDIFGQSVSISGDTIVVGGTKNPGFGGGFGSAYVFIRSGSVWVEQQKLSASDVAAGDLFGDSVSISGDTIVVGATKNIGHGGIGSAYVFIRSGGVWTEQQKLTANDGAARDYFGYSVSISGDTIIVGADGSSSAYVFVRSGSVWTQQQKLTSIFRSYAFGYSVSINGDIIAVGSPMDDEGIGSVHVFEPEGKAPPDQSIPEFPTVALPVISVIGLMLLFHVRKGK